MTRESSDAKNLEDLNVDFENFSVPKERSEELRSVVQRVKDARLVDDFLTLVQGLGVDEVSSQDNQVAGLIKSKNPKVFRYPVSPPGGEDAKLFEIFLFEQEMRALIDGKPILELSFLPKDKDFVLFYVESGFLDSWDEFSQNIAEVVKESQKIKTDRQRHFNKFNKKFKKESVHEDNSEDLNAE